MSVVDIIMEMVEMLLGLRKTKIPELDSKPTV